MTKMARVESRPTAGQLTAASCVKRMVGYSRFGSSVVCRWVAEIKDEGVSRWQMADGVDGRRRESRGVDFVMRPCSGTVCRCATDVSLARWQHLSICCFTYSNAVQSLGEEIRASLVQVASWPFPATK